jgi:hypothetical protein
MLSPQAASTATQRSNLPLGKVIALAVADLNNDGHADLVLATGADGEIVTLLGNGNGTFGPPKVFQVPGI